MGLPDEIKSASNGGLADDRPRRGAYAKSEHTREMILEAAGAVFAVSGYRAGSLKDIASNAGLSEAGVLHHFRSKREILLAVRRSHDATALRSMESSGGGAAELLDALVQLARKKATAGEPSSHYIVVAAEATSHDHAAHDYFVERYERTRRMLTKTFESLQSDHQLRAGVEPLQAAVTFIALLDGLQVQWLLDPESVDMPDVLNGYLETILAGPVDLDDDAEP